MGSIPFLSRNPLVSGRHIFIDTTFHAPFIFCYTYGTIVSVKKMLWRKALHKLFIYYIFTVTAVLKQLLWMHQKSFAGIKNPIVVTWIPVLFSGVSPVCLYVPLSRLHLLNNIQRKAVILGYTLCFLLSLQPSSFCSSFVPFSSRQWVFCILRGSRNSSLHFLEICEILLFEAFYCARV